ncbi:hypothetical protein COB55_03415 [Candidatus Wolfebacteria bacterium]|nr:MAG: hypothetical protein COB55_03415 [Candidatus Wolfebacteria bacterium]
MKFKVGDKIRLREDSKHYTFGINNPKDTNGIIKSLRGINILVDWGGGITNYYMEKDLEFWYVRPLEELYKKIPTTGDLVGEDYVYIGMFIESNEYLSSEDIEKCRTLWEKYN